MKKIVFGMLLLTTQAQAAGSAALCARFARETQKMLPMALSKDMTFFAAICVGSTVTLNVMTRVKPDVKRGANGWHRVLNSNCTDPAVRSLLNKGVSVEYVYSSYEGKYLDSVTTSSSDCVTSGL